MNYDLERNILELFAGMLVFSIVSLISLFLIFFGYEFQLELSELKSDSNFEFKEIKEEEYISPLTYWKFDSTQDLQYPELPTGCEATAASTLLRMDGIEVTKFDVANKLPKSDSDCIYCFVGDPYSSSGWCCMSPCISITLSEFIDLRKQYIEVSKGKNLENLTTPCEIWVTMYLESPLYTGYESNGYVGVYNPHAIVIKEIDTSNHILHCVDP